MSSYIYSYYACTIHAANGPGHFCPALELSTSKVARSRQLASSRVGYRVLSREFEDLSIEQCSEKDIVAVTTPI